jgi:hypothetical protein
VNLGLVQFYALDSSRYEPDGIHADSTQADWLQEALAGSQACYNLVYFHHAPYSSGNHGSTEDLRWPYEAWGADAVFSGHEHTYERLEVNGFPYFVNGAGGASLRYFPNLYRLSPEAISVARYNEDYGAMLISAQMNGITYQFFNTEGELIDELQIARDCQEEEHDPFEK